MIPYKNQVQSVKKMVSGPVSALGGLSGPSTIATGTLPPTAAPKPTNPAVMDLASKSAMKKPTPTFTPSGSPTPAVSSTPTPQAQMNAVKQATLINPQGQRVVVGSGSPEAQNYFSQGYTLMGAPQTSAVGASNSTLNGATTSDNTQGGTSEARNQFGQTMAEANDPKYWNNGKYVGPSNVTDQTNPPPQPEPPAPPPNPTDTLNDVYVSSLGPNADVTSATNALNDVNNQAQTADQKAQDEYAARVAAINGQATLQPFLTGRQRMASGELNDQLSAIQAKAAAQTMPLQQRLAAFQAQQQGTQAQAKARLDYAQAQQAAKLAAAQQTTGNTKPFQVGDNIYTYNPKTGTYDITGTSNKGTETASIQEYKFAQANGYKGSFTDYQNEDANRKSGASSSDRPLTLAEQQAYNMPAGTTIGQINGMFADEKNMSAADAKVNAIAQTMPSDIKELRTLLTGADRWKIAALLAGTDPNASRLIDRVADKVGRIRSGGAINTQEAQSFKDQILRAGDLLSGNTTAALAALDSLDTEITDVSHSLNAGRRGAGSGSGQSQTVNGIEYVQGADGLYYPKTSVGGDTNKATTPVSVTDVKKVADAIGQFESGGNYQIRSKKPDRHGDYAWGKYQIMGANIPVWTKEILGHSMTIDQFRNDPAAQDKVAQAKMGQYIKQYGNLGDVSSAWFSGGSFAQNKAKSDSLGTSVPTYVKNIEANYHNFG